MAASKKPAKTKGKVKFKDLKAKKNAKGGAFDTYDKVGGTLSVSASNTDKYTPSFKSIG